MRLEPAILLIARPGPLRESLQVLLTALPGSRPVVLLDGWLSETLREIQSEPVLVLVVFEPDSLETEVSAATAQVKNRWPHVPLIVLADMEQQHQAAASAGADRVWFNGTLAAQMLVEIEMLLNE